MIKALWALVIAIGIQFIYIAFRFGWNYIFGTVVVVALVRDSLMMIGIYAISGRRADDAFLAAVLTVIGYSVMDTIVILDRIRENQKLMVGEPYDKIVNTSILQTMTRSVYTLVTVVIVLLALLFFGGVPCRTSRSRSWSASSPAATTRSSTRRRSSSAARRASCRARDAPGERAQGRATVRAPLRRRVSNRAAANAMTRDEVVAARKERRAKETAACSRPGGAPRAAIASAARTRRSCASSTLNPGVRASMMRDGRSARRAARRDARRTASRSATKRSH